jgi:hypothetical protein
MSDVAYKRRKRRQRNMRINSSFRVRHELVGGRTGSKWRKQTPSKKPHAYHTIVFLVTPKAIADLLKALKEPNE